MSGGPWTPARPARTSRTWLIGAAAGVAVSLVLGVLGFWLAWLWFLTVPLLIATAVVVAVVGFAVTPRDPRMLVLGVVSLCVVPLSIAVSVTVLTILWFARS